MEQSKNIGLWTVFIFMMIIVCMSYVQAQECKINEPVNLQLICTVASQIPSPSATYNLSVYYPNGSTLVNNVAAQAQGQGSFNYTLTHNTTGTYTIKSFCYDTAGNFSSTETYYCNPSGKAITSQQTNLIIIGLVVFFILAGFFFLLSYMFKHPGTKIFLMALSTLTLILIIGMVASNAAIYLSEYPTIVNMYNTYYKFIIIMAGVCMFGIIGWLIYYSLQLFNKSRGVDFDD
jgi:hypothetical protein